MIMKSEGILKVEELVNFLQVCLESVVRKVLIPMTPVAEFGKVPSGFIGAFNLIFYSIPQKTVFKAWVWNKDNARIQGAEMKETA